MTAFQCYRGEVEMSNRRACLAGVVACGLLALSAAPSWAGTKKHRVRYDKETMQEPKVVHKVAPQYPADAKEEGVQGVVVLDALIGEDGSIRETTVQEGADARLVEAARTAVAQWRYEPVKDEDGNPIELLFTVTINFKLN
jgi:TonB family protein